MYTAHRLQQQAQLADIQLSADSAAACKVERERLCRNREHDLQEQYEQQQVAREQQANKIK